MNSKLAVLCGSLAALLLCAPAFAAQVSGVVKDEAGKPVPFVRINVSAPDAVPATLTVFSGADGTFSSPGIKSDAGALEVEAFRIGGER